MRYGYQYKLNVQVFKKTVEVDNIKLLGFKLEDIPNWEGNIHLQIVSIPTPSKIIVGVILQCSASTSVLSSLMLVHSVGIHSTYAPLTMEWL